MKCFLQGWFPKDLYSKNVFILFVCGGNLKVVLLFKMRRERTTNLTFKYPLKAIYFSFRLGSNSCISMSIILGVNNFVFPRLKPRNLHERLVSSRLRSNVCQSTCSSQTK